MTTLEPSVIDAVQKYFSSTNACKLSELSNLCAPDHVCVPESHYQEQDQCLALDDIESVLVESVRARVSFLEQRDRCFQHRTRLYEDCVSAACASLDVVDEAAEARHTAAVADLVMEAFDAIQAERNAYRAYFEQKKRQTTILLSLAQQTLYLSLLGNHLAFDSHGMVELKRLPHNESDFERCCSVIAGNIKTGFFQHTPYQSISIAEVFKLVNRSMLTSFRAESKKTTFVTKGLFCCIPAQSIERLSVFGFHEPSEHTWNKLFQQWIDDRRSVGGQVRNLVDQSRPLDAPFYFSRKCTLESERLSLSKGNNDTANRYLVLCRVLVDANETSPLDPLTPRSEYRDCVEDIHFDANLQEYAVRNPARILPEFIFQFHFTEPPVALPVGVGSGAKTVEESMKACGTVRAGIAKRLEAQSTARAQEVFSSMGSPQLLDVQERMIESLREQARLAKETLAHEKQLTAQIKTDLKTVETEGRALHRLYQ